MGNIQWVDDDDCQKEAFCLRCYNVETKARNRMVALKIAGVDRPRNNKIWLCPQCKMTYER